MDRLLARGLLPRGRVGSGGGRRRDRLFGGGEPARAPCRYLPSSSCSRSACCPHERAGPRGLPVEGGEVIRWPPAAARRQRWWRRWEGGDAAAGRRRGAEITIAARRRRRARQPDAVEHQHLGHRDDLHRRSKSLCRSSPERRRPIRQRRRRAVAAPSGAGAAPTPRGLRHAPWWP